MRYLRRAWVRVTVALAVVSLAGALVVAGYPASELRASSARALQAVLLVFTVTAALAVFLLTHYVRGVRAAMLVQAKEIRDIAWRCYDQFGDSVEPATSAVIYNHIVPLLTMPLRDLLNVEDVKDWSQGIHDRLNALPRQEQTYVLLNRYLVPLEDACNELGLLFIRSVITGVHARTFRGVFQLVAFAILVVAASHIAPASLALDLAVALAAVATIALAITELLLVVSFLIQESREELPIELQ